MFGKKNNKKPQKEGIARVFEAENKKGFWGYFIDK